ncbi:hypothetical protein TrLO_g11084 [Triparma laevis f. longispina]|uniref:Uncharacterized protein n=1 Tax=Triparma laevis f. longispina TaxID=1714387 RepID=A0A9W7FID3_9STRA|nr:hypothetical protein TrLO_g11084 [Triparma laevis f. longispina]
MLNMSTFKKLAAFITSLTFSGTVIAGMAEGRLTMIWLAANMILTPFFSRFPNPFLSLVIFLKKWRKTKKRTAPAPKIKRVMARCYSSSIIVNRREQPYCEDTVDCDLETNEDALMDSADDVEVEVAFVHLKAWRMTSYGSQMDRCRKDVIPMGASALLAIIRTSC